MRRTRSRRSSGRAGLAATRALAQGQPDANVFVEEMQRIKEELVYRWEPLLEGIREKKMRSDVALLLENQKRYARGFMEDLTTGDIATFDKFAQVVGRAN